MITYAETISGFRTKSNANPALWEVLTGADLDTLAPAQVQFGLLPAVAKDAKRSISYDIADGKLSILF